MNDDRIESQLRAWMAAEAETVTMPEGLRDAAAGARTRPAPRWRPGWSLSLPRPVLAGVATLAVVAAGASLVLSGVLPIGRADCSRVSVESVRAAAEAIEGYRYTMVASELQSRPVLGESEIGYATATFELAGAYRAPDAWSVNVLRYDDPDGPPPPSVGFALVMNQFDAFVFVDGVGWARRIGSDRFVRRPAAPALEGVGRSRILDLLAGEPFRFDPTGAPSYERALDWTVLSTGSGCTLASIPVEDRQLPGTTWKLELEVDRESMLPVTAHYRLASPEGPAEDDGLAPSAIDIQYDFTFDYTSVPVITPPNLPD